MALNKPALQNEIKTLLQDMMNREQASFDEFAQRLSDAIDVYVKTATVTTTVVGTCPAGPVTGTGTGTLS